MKGQVQVIPETTREALIKYETRLNYCGCADYQQREGGSYTDEHGQKFCKHIALYTELARRVIDEKPSQDRQRIDYLEQQVKTLQKKLADQVSENQALASENQLLKAKLNRQTREVELPRFGRAW